MKPNAKNQHDYHVIRKTDIVPGGVYETGMGRIEVTVRPRTRERHRWYEATLSFCEKSIESRPSNEFCFEELGHVLMAVRDAREWIYAHENERCSCTVYVDIGELCLNDATHVDPETGDRLCPSHLTGGFLPPVPLSSMKSRKLGQEKDHESS